VDTAGQEFRAEFQQAVDVLGQFSGPRIIELDGNAAPCDRNPDAARIWLGEKMRSIFG